MGRVLEPLMQMGARGARSGATTAAADPARHAPTCMPIEYRAAGASAQIKSAVLLAGLHAAGDTTVIEAEATRDHTERMLRHFGAEVTVAERDGARAITVKGEPSSRAATSTCRAIRARPPSWSPPR